MTQRHALPLFPGSCGLLVLPRTEAEAQRLERAALSLCISPWRPTPTAQARAQALALLPELRCQTRASCGTSSSGEAGAAPFLRLLGGSLVSRAYSPVLSGLLSLGPPLQSFLPSSIPGFLSSTVAQGLGSCWQFLLLRAEGRGPAALQGLGCLL